MRGSLQVRDARASGWAFDPAAEARSVEVRLRVGEAVIGQGLADRPRRDLAAKLGIAGHHGFSLPLEPAPGEGKQLVLEARTAPDRPWRTVALRSRRAQYQSFDDAGGSSRSSDKLAALRLELLPNRGSKTRPLEGLSLLDLGCNEGFFCGEALRHGATRVVGIDASPAFVDRARKRFPQAEFRSGSWWELPDEKFDVILFLSAIHYEPDPAALLRKLAGHLAPGGTLVIECGISLRPGRRWQTVTRTDARLRYPTQGMLVDEICAPFATRAVGPSVAQTGDPMTRKVFHCALFEGIVLLVAGPGRSGKSTLAREFRRLDVPVLSTDRVLGAVLRDPRFDGTRLAATVRRYASERPVHFGLIGEAVAAERPGEFVEALLAELPPAREMICIEGEILRHRAIADRLSRELRARSLRPWYIAARQPNPIGAAASRVTASLRSAIVRARIATYRATRAWRAWRDQPAARDEAPGA